MKKIFILLLLSLCACAYSDKVEEISTTPSTHNTKAFCVGPFETSMYSSCEEIKQFNSYSPCASYAIELCNESWNVISQGAQKVFLRCLSNLETNKMCDLFEVNICYLHLFTDLCDTDAALEFCREDYNVCIDRTDCATQFSMYTEDHLEFIKNCFSNKKTLPCNQALNECIYDM